MCVCFGLVHCLNSASQASFMVRFTVVAWGLHRDGIIMVSCSAFYNIYTMLLAVHVSVIFLYPSRNDGGLHRNCTL